MTELIEAAGDGQVTPRFVRFLIAEGVIGPPSGGRAHAEYSHEHLRGILSYLRLRRLGFSLTQVKEIFKSKRGETLPVEVAPGVALHIDLVRLNRDLSPAEVAARVDRALAEILDALHANGDNKNAKSRSRSHRRRGKKL